MFLTWPELAAGLSSKREHIIGGKWVFEPPTMLKPKPFVGDRTTSTIFSSPIVFQLAKQLHVK